MPYAILRDGAPVEIPAGVAWTSTQYKVGMDEATAADEATELDAGIGDLVDLEAGHPANALDIWNDAERERYGVLTFDLPEPPEGQVLASYTLDLVEGAVVATGVFAAPPVPEEVTRAQGRCQLAAEGILADLDTFVAGLDAAVEQNRLAKEYWLSTDRFIRDNAMLIAMWAAFGRTSDQLDASFRGAKTFPL